MSHSSRMPPGVAGNPKREVDFLLSRVCRRHHTRAHQLLEEIGLYRGQPPLLHVLLEQPGLTQAEIAAHMQTAPATVTKSLQRLEKAGFVARRADAADQRVLRVYLTEAGEAVTGAMDTVLTELAEETLAGFEPEEIAQLHGLLTRLRANLDHALGALPLCETQAGKP